MYVQSRNKIKNNKNNLKKKFIDIKFERKNIQLYSKHGCNE